MLGVGSELASQSQRESARLEVQPLLDPNKHTSEVQANQRNDHTTDNDEYESVSVIERPVGPLPESNMISESIPAARDLSLEPKQSKNSPTCPLTESNFYKNLVETLQKYPLEWNSTVQVSQDRNTVLKRSSQNTKQIVLLTIHSCSKSFIVYDYSFSHSQCCCGKSCDQQQTFKSTWFFYYVFSFLKHNCLYLFIINVCRSFLKRFQRST
ncbi:Hypothetical_protein [Hexamita inflata]|uniref:Hypothetical_protein n=1 Tax=Hexamita inflata TaxID=28002 RepID=A0AA86QAR7_9EUKA|nr:Hypothetical protein HINF_LOCUS37102 [Hexamita inflata]